MGNIAKFETSSYEPVLCHYLILANDGLWNLGGKGRLQSMLWVLLITFSRLFFFLHRTYDFSCEKARLREANYSISETNVS